MFVDFTTQSMPTLWALAAALVILAVMILTCIDPELAEVYLGDIQLLLGTLALAAIALVMLSGHHPEMPRAVGQLLPAR